MLTQLHISNFAVIEDQTIAFGEGLNVISGETGAGKSIILKALDFILGEKLPSQSIRSGKDSLEVSALLDLTGLPASALEELPDIAHGEELTLTRSLSNTGKGKIFINGRLSTVGTLAETAGKLINICGQNQNIRLLEPRYHLDLIDEFADAMPLRKKYYDAYTNWQKLSAIVQEFEEKNRARSERQAELESIVEELGALKLEPGIRTMLEGKVKKLTNAENLLTSAHDVEEVLNEDDGIFARLNAIAIHLRELYKADPTTTNILELYQTADANLKELQNALKSYSLHIETDEGSLAKLRDELAEIARLERKYRVDDAGLCALLVSSRRELGLISDPGNIDKLRAEANDAYDEAVRLAQQLSKARTRAGEKLSKEVAQELKELNMKGVKFSLKQEEAPLGPLGADQVELLISTLPGEPLKPLKLIASGGELSRITLVLKKLLRDRSGVSVLVFDEVDSGISGGVARAVGEKLKNLAKYSQVICITHLPQVASLADQHFVVDKQLGKRAISVIRELDKKARVEEIARMLAGYSVTKASRESARELLSSKS